MPTFAIGKDAFQEADITGITMPITKHNYLVTEPGRPAAGDEGGLPHRAHRPARARCWSTSRGTCQRGTLEFGYPEKVDLRGYRPTRTGHPKMIERAAELIDAARAAGDLRRRRRQRGRRRTPSCWRWPSGPTSPVTTTLMGKGGFPDEHELSLGMLGMHGTAYANYALHEADLIIAVGARFDDRVTGKLDMFAPNAKIIHIDIDPAEIGKNVAAGAADRGRREARARRRW